MRRMAGTYSVRTEKDGEIEGWFHAPDFDLFLWFQGNTVAHLQICAGADIAEWHPAGALPTGRLLGRKSGAVGMLASREDTILNDAGISPARVAHVVSAVERIDLPPEVRAFALAALRNEPVEPAASALAGLVRALPTPDG